MSGTAIVAIPSQDDYVWKISSEKVPHMTLLFLGDQSANPNLEDIVQFVRHVVKTSMRPFGVTVDHRGELGPDKADVLFFSDDYRQLDMVKQARDFMLTDAHILEAYNSTEQFDKWTPHLTLGYPETPAHPDNRNYPGISWINFDRIAVWTGDYAGPDFQLEDNHTNLEVSMSDIVDKVLAHHGVKGMKWGVRKDDSTRQRLGLQSRSATKPKPSEDKASANASAAKVKRGNTDSLSNKELQQLVNRMNLEQQYSRLSSQSGTVKRGQQGVKDVLAVGKTANEAAQFAQSPIGKAIGRGIKAAALSAAAAAGKMAAKRALKRS